MAVAGLFFYLIAIFGTGKLLLNYAPISKPSLAWMTAGGVVTSLNYAWAVASYHYKRRRSFKEELPPVYPAPVPFLGSAVSLAWDVGGFLAQATCVPLGIMILPIFDTSHALLLGRDDN
jgi:hypothetical protein